MATGTVLPPEQTDRPDERIIHPLDRLRGSIRRYVLIDGLLTAGLFVVLWFWLGLLIDFGVFKLTTFDWVLDAPKALRTIVLITLGALLLGILITRLAIMLTRTFSYPSLALVLEKRFPQLLGDRLITAVELADVDKAKSYGFSEDMVRQTIADARERVQQVPIDDVFNWRRLKRKGALLGLKALGTLLLVFGAYAIWARTSSARDFGRQFADVSAIWAERNLLLRNTPWPRRAHLEVVDFPDSGDLRIGKDAPPPKVKVRAFKWVIADRSAVHGWRPLQWSDLTEKFLGAKVPADAAELPTWDVDQVEAVSGGNPEVRTVLDRLDALAAKPAMSRTLRKLAVPADVTLSYAGPKTRGSLTLTPEQSNEFSGEVAGLKESVRFTVRGENFVTLPRTITLVPPPMLTRLTRTEYQPAYLYHTPPTGEDFPALKGLRQVIAEKDLSLTGDKSVFSIMSGTEFVLKGTSDKPLSKVLIRPKIGKLPGLPAGSTEPLVLAPEGDDRERFTLAFRGADKPVASTEFDVTLVDDDGVTLNRTVLVQVAEDQVPQVELAVDVLRKSGNTYLVTPVVRVPFLTDSLVRDDTGLSKVDYVLTYSQVETQFFLGVQAQTLAGIFAGAPAQIGWPTVIAPAASVTLAQRLVRNDRRQTKTLSVGRFAESLQSLGADTRELLTRKLGEPAEADKARVVKEVKFQNPQVDYFDLREALPGLGEPDSSGIQPRYRMELNVVATDANVETGPKTGQNLEPVRLLVVSEADLLMEISKDEETLIAKVDEALKKLREAQIKLGQTADRLSSPTPPPDVIISSAVRAQDISQDLAKAKDITQGVLTDYRRLYREAEVNRCSETLLKRYLNEIITPVQAIVDGAFVQSEQAHALFQSALAEGRKPDEPVIADDRLRLAELIRELTAIRDKLGEVLSINKLRDQAQQILNNQKQLGVALDLARRAATDRLAVPVIATIPVIELAKGEKRAIKQPLDWGIYSGDAPYTVKFQAPEDSGLKLPAEVRVPDDKNDVEYEILAGEKTGEFKVTLAPSVGNPAVVTVRVK